MSHYLLTQFELLKVRFLGEVEDLTDQIVSIQPEGFNNTILWHIGHLVTVNEQFMFGYPKKSTFLPGNYLELFAKGTSPADWNGDIQTLADLVTQFNEQIARTQQIPVERFEERLKQPFLGLESYGDITNLALFHIAYHLGQIHAMKLVIKNLI
ncbi:DinB family protein [Bacillus sp. JJ1521]|uniref:DinB family protein n=1 Tax=Bacillus sp. JJ1521 TaxID=3122957 RepID=UPI002FFDB6DF